MFSAAPVFANAAGPYLLILHAIPLFFVAAPSRLGRLFGPFPTQFSSQSI
jgi:hypothetical protein